LVFVINSAKCPAARDEDCYEEEQKSDQANRTSFRGDIDVIVMSMSQRIHENRQVIARIGIGIVANTNTGQWVGQKHTDTGDPVRQTLRGRVILGARSNEGDLFSTQQPENWRKHISWYPTCEE